MFEVVCIGAATEDLFFFSDHFQILDQGLFLPWKEKFTVEGLERRLGGGAFNASVAFSRLGLKVAFFGRVGNDRAGEAVREFFEKEGISAELLVVDPETKTSTSALLSKDGERTIIMYRGENDDLLDTDPDWDNVLDCRWVFLTDLAGTNNNLLFEVAKQIRTQKGPTLKRLQIRQHKTGQRGSDPKGTKLSYVPGQKEIALGKEKLKPVLAAVEILVLNSYEAEMILSENPAGKPRGFLGIQPQGLRRRGENRRIEEMLVEFKELGVGVSVITSGPEGSTAYDGKEFYHQEITPKVKVIDRTGAGDAFSSTFTAGIILGKSVPESLLLAAKNSSSVVTKVGGTAGLLAISELNRQPLRAKV